MDTPAPSTPDPDEPASPPAPPAIGHPGPDAAATGPTATGPTTGPTATGPTAIGPRPQSPPPPSPSVPSPAVGRPRRRRPGPSIPSGGRRRWPMGTVRHAPRSGLGSPAHPPGPGRRPPPPLPLPRSRCRRGHFDASRHRSRLRRLAPGHPPPTRLSTTGLVGPERAVVHLPLRRWFGYDDAVVGWRLVEFGNASAIAAKVDPGLVDVNVTLNYQGESAAGTGQVLTSSGLVLTNNHVIDEATSISAIDIGNGQTYTASVVGYDRTGDLAVIQLHGASGLNTVYHRGLVEGDGRPSSIVAIGNAGGVGGTPSVASGTVTTAQPGHHGQRRQRWQLRTIDRAHRGERQYPARRLGGPLVNSAGHVVGIDTAASSGVHLSRRPRVTAMPFPSTRL